MERIREHIERTAARPLPSREHWHWPQRGRCRDGVLSKGGEFFQPIASLAFTSRVWLFAIHTCGPVERYRAERFRARDGGRPLLAAWH